ncbi:M20/M25/M40 family metallo-hydrolase [Flavivirga eckloniae]|uniref:Peptidase M20 n=1 Tax=Flavivirga eckloniae TaxID=1803846 RepID=A0A2K9PU81_9FLAO|nr:M20/M25/M40 family metallo-hydrolase [Flavivirga eckloniae]AUP80621.1 peptidase M20 [Flavivirga eckloniae]
MNISLYKTALTVIVFSCLMGYTQNDLKADKTYTKEINKITKRESVKLAFETIDLTDKETIANMILLNEIPAPPFKEATRAKKYVELFKKEGIDRVWIDKEGNVLALRKGTKGDRNIVLDAHIDTVFPIETDVTVKIEGNTYTAPGIGDNTRGMAMLLAVLKAMNTAKLQTEANVCFVGTVGEEGLGDLRGVKHLFSEASDIKIDSWISIDGGSAERIINGGLGSKRYKAVFKGKGGHSWGAFGLANPHHALGYAIKQFTEEATKYTNIDGPKTSFNIGRIGGGTSVNSIPFESWMEVDMRSLSPKRLLEIDEIFKTCMKKAEADYNATGIKDKVTLEIVPIGDRPSGQLSEDTPLIQRAIASAQYLGISPKLRTGSTNSNIPIASNIPATTLSRGGKGKGAHSLNEKWTNIDATKNIKLALLLVLSEAGFVK